MVLEDPLIRHLEVSKQGFVLDVLPFGKIQTRFCISMTYHSKPFGESTLYTVVSPFKTIIANSFKWCIKLYEKGTKSRRVNKHSEFDLKKKNSFKITELYYKNLDGYDPFPY